MNIEELIQKLEQREIFLTNRDGQLVVKTARPVHPGVNNTIRLHERQLLQYLSKNTRANPANTPSTPAASYSRVPTRTTTTVCFELLEAPPTRTEAVERLVVTFRPEIHDAQRQRWLTTTLSGKPVSDAPEGYLLAEAVGLMAWAQEREERGVFNRGAYEWITAAWQAVERRAHHLKVA